ncbi:hypothetical protein IWW45_009306, partial [Coemansia sp. RSA 485]
MVPTTGGMGLQLLSPQSATLTAVADSGFNQTIFNQYHASQTRQQQQQIPQATSLTGLDQGYGQLLRSMNQTLVQGPPINLQTSRQQMIESVCRTGLTETSNGRTSTLVDGLDEEKLWRLYTRSENVLPNGSRARNLLWRMQSRQLKHTSVRYRLWTAGRDLQDAMRNIAHKNMEKWPGTGIGSTVLHGPLTESPKTAAVSDYAHALGKSSDYKKPASSGSGRHTAVLSMPAKRQTETEASAETEMTLLDFRRRSSSHTVAGTGNDTSAMLGLESAATLQPQQHYMTLPLPRQQQQQQQLYSEQPYAPAPTTAATLDLDIDLEL